MKFENPFSKKKEAETPSERILPSDVRYALRYKEEHLTTSEILDLIENGFEEEALYLLLKSSVANVQLQLAFLEQIVTATLDTESVTRKKSLRTILHSMLTQLPTETLVDAHKLSVLSRQGFDAWHDLYKKTADELVEKDADIFMLGHSTFLGLTSFITSFSKRNKKLYLLIPGHYNNTAMNTCGYIIENGAVSVLERDFIRPHDAILLDDIRNSGESVNEALIFWKEYDEGASEPELVILQEVT